MEKKDFHAFTYRPRAKVNVLTTPIKLSLPHDPNKDKDNQIPTQIDSLALWDTGATHSCVTKRMAETLGLKPTGKGNVSNTSETKIANTYLINMYLPNLNIQYLNVFEIEQIGSGVHDFLIGMDIIGSGDFSVTGVNGETVMSFRYPSIKAIDYVEMANEERSRRIIEDRALASAKNRKPQTKKEIQKKKRDRSNKRKSRKK